MACYPYPKSVDAALLVKNRDLLRGWQGNRWYNDPGPDKVRLHLGSGKLKLPFAINVDFTAEADVQCDIRQYPYTPASVDDIICHHVLEHLPMHDVPPLITQWAQALRPGGTVEIGVPDMDLIARCWLDSEDHWRWSWLAWTIYGVQTDELPGYPWDSRPYNPHMTHTSGFTLGYLVRLLERSGLRMVDAFWYDGFDTPSAFTLATKPGLPRPATLLEQQCIMGTFTHRCEYVPALWQSANRFLPQIEFATVVRAGTIRENMARLREVFKASGKRYWLFLDDDIHFLDGEIVERALQALINGGYAAVHCYSTFDPATLTAPYDPARYGERCVSRDARWATGYFILVDSQLVGDIEPDAGLPDGNTSVDTSYSVAIRAAGYRIGMTPDYVYHTKKDGSWVNQAVIEPTNEYLLRKWGQFYFEIAQYDNNVLDDDWRLAL